ncbi:MAG: HEAT repeat domain-containing protein [Chloroflexota bacterium]|nr:HEAT repeat domain-containing protein [Chloroflexota bacterium]
MSFSLRRGWPQGRCVMGKSEAERLFEQRDFGALVELCEVGDASDRQAAVGYLGALRRQHVSDALRRALLQDDDEAVQAGAARALASVGGECARDTLLEATSPSARTRALISEALGILREQRALSKLIECLHDDDERVRAATARALGRIGRAEAVRPLSELLGDESRHVRSRAREALVEIGDAGAVDVVRRARGRFAILRWFDARAAQRSVQRAAARARGEIPEPLDRLTTKLVAVALKAFVSLACLTLLDLVVVGAPAAVLVPIALLGGVALSALVLSSGDELLDIARWRAEPHTGNAQVAPWWLTTLRTFADRPLALAVFLGVPLVLDALMGGWGVLPAVAAGLIVAVVATRVFEALLVLAWEDETEQLLLVDGGSDPLKRHRFFAQPRLPSSYGRSSTTQA